jgi:AbrB family looped-hinge helix DNA binding protein
MATATVTSKGQITIPSEVRKKLGLSTGSRVDFIQTDDGFEIVPATSSVRSLRGVVSVPDGPVSIEAMDEAIATGAAGRSR